MYSGKVTTFLGVDPAFREGGFWACILETNTDMNPIGSKTATMKQFKDAIDFDRWIYRRIIYRDTAHLIVHDMAPDWAFSCIENSNLQNASFDTSGRNKVIARKARNVGTNQAASELAYRSAVSLYGKDMVSQVSPQRKGRKITDDKIFRGIVKQDGFSLIGYTGNQDQRDAYMIACIGMYESKIKKV